MAQYIVDQEIGGVTLLSARNLGVIDNPENQRFHDVGILTHVEFVGNPVAKGGVRFGWFSEPPANTIPHHAKDTYWNLIQPLLI